MHITHHFHTKDFSFQTDNTGAGVQAIELEGLEPTKKIQ